MVMCKYFLQGRCCFGENCKNEHSYDSSRRYYASQAQQTPTQNRSFNDVKQIVSEELRQTEAGKQWLFSCFSPLKDITLPGLDDVSPEELRYDAYQAQSQNNIEAYKVRVEQLQLDYMNKRNQFANMDVNLFQAIFFKDKSGTSAVSSAPPTSALSQSASLFGNNGNQSQSFQGSGVFGGTSAADSATSQASSFSFSSLGAQQQNTSIFGGAATFSQSSFVQAPPPPYSQSSVSSIFGQAPSSTTPAFGTQTTPSGQTAFGQTQGSSMFGQSTGNTFGVTTTASPSNVFGQNASVFGQTTPTNSNVFGQSAATPTNTFGQNPSTPTNVFGQVPSTPTNTNVFGQTATTPTNTNVFGQTATTPINMNVFGQTATTPTNTNVFGQTVTTPTNSNVFGQTASTPTNSNVFGQTASTPTNVFGQSSATPTTPTSSNVFGQAVTTPTASNVFGQTATTPVSGNVFGQASSYGSPSVFGQTTPTSNVFGQTQSASVFGGQSEPPSFTQPQDNTFTNQNTFSQGSNVFGTSPAFTQPQTTTSSVFGQSDNNANPFKPVADNSKPNPFHAANNEVNNFYSLLEDLSEEMRKAFEATDFELGKIPTKPPPKELCF